MYTKVASLPNLYIRNIIPNAMSIPLLGYLALSGWGEAFINGHLADACTVFGLYPFLPQQEC